MKAAPEKVAAVPFTEEIGGKAWTFSPLRNLELVRLMEHARSRKASAVATLGKHYETLPPAMRADALKVALEEDRKQVLTDEDWDAYLVEPEGAAHFLWLSLVQHHADVTEETVIEEILPALGQNEALGLGVIKRLLERSGMIEEAGEESKKNETGEANQKP